MGAFSRSRHAARPATRPPRGTPPATRAGARLYNPSCRYDAASRRWFLAAAASAAGITVSVSEGPDPTRAWRHYLLSPPAEPGLALPAFRIPWLAVHPEAVVVSANL